MGRIVFSSASFAVGIVESSLILWFFGVPVSLELALAIEVSGVLLNNLMIFVPLRVGTQEAGKVLVFAMLGLDSAQGLAAGLISRIRELAWAFIGLAHSGPISSSYSTFSAVTGSLAGSRPDPVGGLPRNSVSHPTSPAWRPARPRPNSCSLRSFNEWDPFEKVIVGSLEGAVMPPSHITLTRTILPLAAQLYQGFGGRRSRGIMVEAAPARARRVRPPALETRGDRGSENRPD